MCVGTVCLERWKGIQPKVLSLFMFPFDGIYRQVRHGIEGGEMKELPTSLRSVEVNSSLSMVGSAALGRPEDGLT